MQTNSQLWVETFCKHLADNERQTVANLGREQGEFFGTAASDSLTVFAAIRTVYPGDIGLVLGTGMGLFNELGWLQFLFVAANYPLLLSRLRFVWESMARAYFAENFSRISNKKWTPPGPSPDEQLAWLNERSGNELNWSICVEPVIRSVFPSTEYERDKEIKEIFQTRWDYLNRYVHPSAYLTGRKLDTDSVMISRFDEEWARSTVEIGAFVLDLTWLTALANHPKAANGVEELHGRYPLVTIWLDRCKAMGIG